MTKKEVERTHLTPPVVAQMLGSSPESILSLIHSGELPAVNLSQGGLRPRWRISKKDLTAFLAARSNQVPEVKPGPRANAIPKPSKRFV